VVFSDDVTVRRMSTVHPTSVIYSSFSPRNTSLNLLDMSEWKKFQRNMYITNYGSRIHALSHTIYKFQWIDQLR